ncbi:polyketide synthase [Nonomuraea antimicrobica]
MAPCGQAQEHVMRRALRQAGVDPGTVGYVEAHGTGTAIGDPLEAAALGAVYGAARQAGQPVLIGSAKSNIGHLEGAAGVAGLVKAVLAVNRGEIPPSRLDTPTSAVDWIGAGLRVVDEPTPWPGSAQPRRAAVSAFGYGGTVAHIILEQGLPYRRPPRHPPGGCSRCPPRRGPRCGRPRATSPTSSAGCRRRASGTRSHCAALTCRTGR